MRRAIVILVAGVLLGGAAYCGLYFATTAKQRSVTDAPVPELAWLKQEFHISDAEFARISALHDGYLPQCREMCARIAAKNAELKRLVAAANALTPEIEQKLAECAQLRLQCQRNMLEHFLQVSRQMPPEQGKRYLAWVHERSSLPDHGMPEQHPPEHGANHH